MNKLCEGEIQDIIVDNTWSAIPGELYITKMRIVKRCPPCEKTPHEIMEVTLSNEKSYFVYWDAVRGIPVVGRLNEEEMTQQVDFIMYAMIGICYHWL